jgi:hypothetical protein
VNHLMGTSTLFELQDDLVKAAEEFDAVSAEDISRIAHEQLTTDRLFAACVGRREDVGEAGVGRLLASLGLGSPSAPSPSDPILSSKSEPSV